MPPRDDAQGGAGHPDGDGGGRPPAVDGRVGEDVAKLGEEPGGRLVVYGATAGAPSAGLDMVRLFFRQTRIIGSTMGSPAEFAAMLNFMVEHHIEPVIDQVFALDQVVAAHQRLLSAQNLGKIVLRHD